MAQQKTSIVWRSSNEEFAAAVAKSTNYSELLRSIGLENIGGNHLTAQKRIVELGLDISHFHYFKRPKGYGALKAKPLADILVENSNYGRNHLKKRILAEGLIENQCVLCGMSPEWNGKPLVLRLDHENGVRNDNRIENLRIVCPNCDSQLPTFCGKHVPRSKQKRCIDCGSTLLTKSSIRCLQCSPKRRRKIAWPSDEEIVARVAVTNINRVSKDLGVSYTRLKVVYRKILADRSAARTAPFGGAYEGSNPSLPATA